MEKRGEEKEYLLEKSRDHHSTLKIEVVNIDQKGRACTKLYYQVRKCCYHMLEGNQKWSHPDHCHNILNPNLKYLELI
jgi:hypothetical protein